jgi:hypothetical protein
MRNDGRCDGRCGCGDLLLLHDSMYEVWRLTVNIYIIDPQLNNDNN